MAAAAVTRVGDVDSRGDSNVTGSSNVFVNGIAVVRTGDTDSRGDTEIGTGTVYVNGQQVVRVGDADTRGNPIVSGSGDVFAG